ncbi:MAG: 50S ribosomal protein L11 methyltransferase [Deltaproteobacteria bacterium]|nr:50S ribosomal protein L11 methyltransferase [Deltaproteobacteria bacterium]
MAGYLTLTLDLPEALVDLASALLHDHAALGLEVRDGQHPPPPSVQSPAAGRAIVVGYFGADADVASVASRARELGDIRLTVASCKDEDWAETWKAHFEPVHVAGRLWVLPPWSPVPDDRDPTVVIEPGMAFGTGSHPTTAWCLETLARILPSRPGAAVLDVGCGSGILGIAAKKLGAGRVTMIDNDVDAVAIARGNMETNGCTDLEVGATPVDRIAGAFDVIVANILAPTLVELAPPIGRRLGPAGELLLSGILDSQAAEVRAAYETQGLEHRATEQSGEWVLVRLWRPG